jgi:dTDP-D-glucose 4,6-dehydratase
MIVAKAQRVLGLKPTPFDEGLKETYRWYMRNRGKPEADYSFEDALLERIRAAS